VKLKNKHKQKQLKVKASTRRSTPEEETRIREAVNLLLAEWVRQRMAKGE
jgi:hypothetical protein